MALLASLLASEIETMVPTDTPGTGEQRLAEAYGEYMKSALAGAVPINGSAVDASAVPAMVGAFEFTAGASSTDGAAVVTTGVSAFWAAMAAAPASFFSGATVVTPPSFAVLTSALAAAFDDATDNSLSLADAAASVASVIHGATSGMGTATFPGPVVSPIV